MVTKKKEKVKAKIFEQNSKKSQIELGENCKKNEKIKRKLGKSIAMNSVYHT